MGGESAQKHAPPAARWFFARRWAYQGVTGSPTLLFNVFSAAAAFLLRGSFRFAGANP